MDYKNKIMEYEIIHQPEQNLFKTEVDGRTALDRKSTRLNSSHTQKSRMPSSA